jgi:hypothetical protein
MACTVFPAVILLNITVTYGVIQTNSSPFVTITYQEANKLYRASNHEKCSQMLPQILVVDYINVRKKYVIQFLVQSDLTLSLLNLIKKIHVISFVVCVFLC